MVRLHQDGSDLCLSRIRVEFEAIALAAPATVLTTDRARGTIREQFGPGAYHPQSDDVMSRGAEETAAPRFVPQLSGNLDVG